MNLTIEEHDLIMEALDHLPHKNQVGEMVGDFLINMLGNDNEEARDEMNKTRRHNEDERKVLAEKCTLIKAKIIESKREVLLGQATEKL